MGGGVSQRGSRRKKKVVGDGENILKIYICKLPKQEDPASTQWGLSEPPSQLRIGSLIRRDLSID